ncbi:MAG: ferritin-like domain-containing protein [Polyangiaceae bacterium]
MKKDSIDVEEATTRPVARKQVLSSGALAAAAAVLGVFANVCGDDDDSSAATGGASAKGGSSSTSKGGASGKGGTGGVDGGGAGGTGAGTDADIEPLNALLTAEYNAITAYTAGAGLINAAPTSDPLSALADVIVEIAVSIQSQHKLHAAALVDAIEGLGGTPVKEATVAAAFAPPSALTKNPSIGNVLKFAASAERGAAVAYNQVLSGLEDAQLRFLAATIEGDETQHFIVLAALVLGLAAPGASLDLTSASTVFPAAFVASVGAKAGLDKAPADYYA